MLKISELVFPRTPWRTGFRICLETKVWLLYFRRVTNMPSSLSFRLESDPSIYGYRHLLKKVEKIMYAMTQSRWTSQRQYFTDLNVFILCFDCLAAINTDLFCILLLPTNCSLNETKSCIIHPYSETPSLKLSKLKELEFELLEFFCYLRTWSTKKAYSLSRHSC